MIERLIIKNFRSIESLDLRLGKLNAFIGPNDSGKTNIMDALNIVLSEYYPSIRLFDDSDFFNYIQNKIEIKAIFDQPLSNNSRVQGFSVEYDGNQFSYMATDNQGNIVQWESGRDIRVDNKMRDEVPLMYVGVNRQASQQIRPTKWTIFGKMLKYIEMNMSDTDKTTYKEETMNVYNRNIEAHLSTFKDIMKKIYQRTYWSRYRLYILVY
jgi:AAA15 family ATPase/GTPase